MTDKSFLTLAKLIGTMIPQAWDAIHPHGPAFDIGRATGATLGQAKTKPQPDPWREGAVIAAADAHIAEIMALTRAADVAGGEGGRGMVAAAARLVADYEEICPRWPKLPPWPPKRGPEPPPWWWEEGAKLSTSEAFFAGARLAHASEFVKDRGLAEAMAATGARMMERALRR